jgi:hypothetical protein
MHANRRLLDGRSAAFDATDGHADHGEHYTRLLTQCGRGRELLRRRADDA